jgi:hypothetical protein
MMNMAPTIAKKERRNPATSLGCQRRAALEESKWALITTRHLASALAGLTPTTFWLGLLGSTRLRVGTELASVRNAKSDTRARMKPPMGRMKQTRELTTKPV